VLEREHERHFREREELRGEDGNTEAPDHAMLAADPSEAMRARVT
jgi:hypothetical protein